MAIIQGETTWGAIFLGKNYPSGNRPDTCLNVILVHLCSFILIFIYFPFNKIVFQINI